MQMPRAHNLHLGNTFDTVSSHSHHVATIAYCLCRMEGLSHEEGMKAVAMATFHDLAEARTGDANFVNKHYGRADEAKATEDMLEGLPFAEDLRQLYAEYEDRETLTAKCAKDADAVDQMYQEWMLAWQGNKMAEKWFNSDFHDRVPSLRTESAKKIVFEMKDSHPQEWWWSQFVKNDAAIDLEKLNGKK